MTTKPKANVHQLRTDEEKAAIVKAFHARGDQTMREFAQDHGVSPQLIYNWSKRIEESEPLDFRLSGKLEQAKARAGAVLERAQAKRKTSPPAPGGEGEEYVPDELKGLPQAIVLELLLLRQENTKMRAALAALLGLS